MPRAMKIPTPRRLPSGSWFIQLRLGGESIPVTASSERECARQAQLIKAEHQAGKRQVSPPPAPTLPTLKEAVDNYIAARSNILSPSTIRGYRIIQHNRFQFLMSRSLSELSDTDWADALNAEAALCGPKTLTNAWRFLGSVVKDTTGHGLPAVTLPQIPPNERPFLDAAQIKSFVSATKGDPYQVPALLALHSLRRSEILALTWEHVDLDNRRILVKGAVVPDEHQKYVEKKTNKNRTSTRYVPILIDELHAALKQAQQPAGPVVTCHPEALVKGINSICDRAKVPRVGTHGLRHSFASLAYHLRVPEDYTRQIGGWSDIQTMRKIYTHIAAADMAHYEEQFSAFFQPTQEENANENANKL